MNNIFRYILLTLLMVCVAHYAYATLKIDVSNLAGKVTETVGRVTGNAQDLVKGVEHTKTYTKMLDGAKEGLGKINELKDKATAWKKAISDAKSQVSSATNSLSSAVSSAVSQAKGMQNSIMNSNAQDLINAQNAQAQAKANYEAQIKDLEASRDAEIKKYQDNNKIIDEAIAADPSRASTLGEQLDENYIKILEIENKYQKLIDNSKQSYEKTNNQYQEQIASLMSAATNIDPLSNVNADSAKKAISGLFGGDSSSAMNAVIAQNFYKDGETPSAERNGEIGNYRKNVALEDTADVYYTAVQMMSAGDGNLEYAKSLQSNTQVSETTPAAVMLDLSLKVETMRSLLNYARLLVAEMKMITAQDMVALSKHLNNYDKDVTEFDLDDYEYKEVKKRK